MSSLLMCSAGSKRSDVKKTFCLMVLNLSSSHVITNVKSFDCEMGDFFEKEAIRCCIIPKAKKAGIHEAYASFLVF